MDLNRLSRGEQIFGVSAALLFLLSFFPLWAKYEVAEEFFGGATQRFSAWSGAFNFLMKLGLIFALLGVALVIAKAAGALDNVDMPVPLGLVYLGLGGLTLLIMLLFLLVGPTGASQPGFEVSRGPLLFVGIVLSAGMAFGGFMQFQGEGRAGTPARRPGPPPAGPPPGA